MIDNKLKIIGITGSKGKTTVAYLLYTYLKKLKLKVELYSSLDYEIPIPNNERLFEIIEKSKKEDIEYLVLEINEENIEKIDNTVFDIKILTNITNINSKNEEEYLEKIKSFFLNSNSKKIITYNSYININIFKEFIKKLDNKKIICSDYTIKKYNLDYDMFDYIVYSNNEKEINNINGMIFFIKEKENIVKVNTNLIFGYNTINILNLFSCLKELKLYDEKIFLNLLKKVNIPGRSKMIKYNNRFIIISPTLSPELEIFYKMKENRQINNIVLVTASIGVGHITWDEEFNNKEQEELLHKSRRFACKYASKYCDFIYLTSSDPASSRPQDIANEMEKCLIDNNFFNTSIIIDRENAIKEAIKKLGCKDVLLISGRGSRRKFIKNNKEYDYSDESLILKYITKR